MFWIALALLTAVTVVVFILFNHSNGHDYHTDYDSWID